MSDNQPPMEFYKQIFGGAWITQGLSVAAELGIADLLADGPCTAEELAAKTGAHADSLYRLLRALAGIGVFSHDEHGRFSLTPLADLMRSDVFGSQRALAILMGGEFHAAWGELLHSTKTGEPGFNKRFGMSFFRYMAEHPDRHDLYDAAMEGVHGSETQPMLDAYDFSIFGTVMDIGGGNGSALAGILARHPTVQGILFDLPAVVERARRGLVESAQASRLQVLGGDFFSAVPRGADAYLLRHVIHDWLDEDAVSILRNCRDAMSPGAKVLVVEMVLPAENEPSFGKWLDLMMLLVAGRERTEVEYSELFAAAGLRMTRVIPTASDVSIVEGVRALHLLRPSVLPVKSIPDGPVPAAVPRDGCVPNRGLDIDSPMRTVQLVRLNPAIEEALAQDPTYFESMARGDWVQVADRVHRMVGRILAVVPVSVDQLEWGGYFVVDQQTREVVGSCAYKRPPTKAGSVEIAYFTYPGFEGRGYASAMARKLIALASKASEVQEVIAHTLPEVNASTRVLEKVGMRFVGEVNDPEDGLVWRWRVATKAEPCPTLNGGPATQPGNSS